MQETRLQHFVFLVDETPYCIWSWDLTRQTHRFLDRIDPTHYEYLANIHVELLQDEEQEQHAALALRTAYSQGLETLFALLGATLQAPYSVPGWMAQYRTWQLRSLVNKIKKFRRTATVLEYSMVEPWRSISNTIHTRLQLENEEKEVEIKEGFGRLWSRFATEFLKDTFNREYNSIKHGL